MNLETSQNLNDGDICKVFAGVHKGKSGVVRDSTPAKLAILPSL